MSTEGLRRGFYATGLAIGALTIVPSAGMGAFSGVSAPTSQWYAMLDGDQFDVSDDPQATNGAQDLVGGNGRPLLYTYYSSESDNIFFRSRVSGMKKKKTDWKFNDVLIIALDYERVDANGNRFGRGDIDLFVVCDRSGNTNTTSVFSTGGKRNSSPSQTSMKPISGLNVAHTAQNYLLSYVNRTIFDNGNHSDDIDGNGGTDGFISFSLPMSMITTAARTILNLTVTPSTSVGYGVLTATQPNAINADFGGIDDRDPIARQTPWSSLTSSPIAPIAVPEPGVLLALGVVSLSALSRRQRKVVSGRKS